MAKQQSMDPVDPSVQPESDLELVLEEYRRRQLMEHLTGPVVSVVMHLLVLVICFVFMVDKSSSPVKTWEFESKPMVVKVFEPKPVLEKPIEKPFDPMTPPEPPEELSTVRSTTTPATDGGGAIEDFNDNMPSSADGGDTAAVLDVSLTKSPITLPVGMGGREPGGRKNILTKIFGPRNGPNGPDYPTETAVIKSLKWLKEHQNSDGSWSQSQKVGMCGLALLCYLAHGELANSKEFGQTVQRAMGYLVERMNETADGEMIKGTDAHGYSHAIAVYALSEAYAMTKLPMLKGPMEKGLATMINGQQECGGWDYKFAKSARWDLSLSGWTMQALKAGFQAGSDNSRLGDALQKAQAFVQKTTYASGRFGYSSEHGAGKENNNYHMTGVGTLCLQLLGQKDSVEAQAGVKTIKENVTVQWRNPDRKTSSVVSFEPYGWYYHTQAMFFNGTSSSWASWNSMFSRELVQAQQTDGHWDAPPTVAGGSKSIGEMEPYYSTTLCCLMLEVYYRLLPSTAKLDFKGNHGTGVGSLQLD